MYTLEQALCFETIPVEDVLYRLKFPSMTIKWTFLWDLRLKGMVYKKLAQHCETAMQSSNMYLAAFQHTMYDNHVFMLLFLQSNSYFTFY